MMNSRRISLLLVGGFLLLAGYLYTQSGTAEAELGESVEQQAASVAAEAVVDPLMPERLPSESPQREALYEPSVPVAAMGRNETTHYDIPVRLQTRFEQEWPGHEVLAFVRTPGRVAGTEDRVAFLKTPDLPYLLRLAETVSMNAAGREEILATHDTIADHVLIQTRAKLTEAELRQQIAPLGMTLMRQVSRRGLWRVSVENPVRVDAQSEALAQLEGLDGLLAYAEPDPIVRTLSSPNDPKYLDGSLWGLHNTGQNGGTAGADIDAPGGWAVTTDASTVIVGVVDTGIRLTHEDLVANLWVNPTEIANGTDTNGNGFIDDIHGINAITLTGNPDDDQGHGTHVAGTIGAVGNNGTGVVGVAWNVQLMGLKFLAAVGGGAVSDAIICIDYGVENGAHILNNSWGGGGFSQALLDAIEASRDAGVIFVAAAGNSGANSDNDPAYPAALPVNNIVSVASTTRNDALSGFSNYGQGTVEIAAPGSDIYSTAFASDTAYVSMSGTSMASPHVAGALALLRAEFPTDSWDQLIHRMYRGVDKIGSLDTGVVSTGGRLNIAKALTSTDNRPHNDDFAEGLPLYGDRALLRVNLRSATAESGEPALQGEASPNSLWFRFTPAASGLASVTAAAGESIWNPMFGTTTTVEYDTIPTVIGIYTGDTVDSLTAVASGNDSTSFTATAGVTYHIAVAGQGGAEGLVMLDIIGAPANSSLENALSLRLSGGVSGTNNNALFEPDEPAHAGQPAIASVWYTWTAGITSRVAFSTRGSSFDTVAAVYTGPAVGATMSSLVPVAANDNATSSAQSFSRVEFQAISGTTYYIAVDGKNGATGNVSAVIGVPPPNDKFANAVVLSGIDVTRGIRTVFAGREEGEPIHWPSAGRGEPVWFTWTAPENGRTTLDLSGSFFRGIIAVYTGNAVNNLSLVASDGASNRFAQITFEATQGTTYRIAVDAWDFPLNNAPLRLQMVPIPPNDHFADAAELQGTSATFTGSNVGATNETGEPNHHGNVSPSTWHKWTAPTSGEYGLYGERLNKAEERWIIMLKVFTGSTVDDLTHVKEDWMNGIGRDAFARFTATAGTTYYIQVTGLTEAGILGGVGPYRLDLRPIAEHAPENDTFANAIELDGSTVFNYRTQNYGASSEPGEGQHSGYDAYRSLWWKFEVPAGQAGTYAVATSLGEGSTGATIYRANNPATPALGALTQVASNVEFANQNFPDVKFQADENEVYYIVLDNYGMGLGGIIFHFQKVPDNVTFANAKVIPAEGLSEITYNWGAVRESGEPISIDGGTAGNRSLWWKWTAPESGRYEVDTIGSRLAVYEDGSIGAQFGNPTILGLNTMLGVYTATSPGNRTTIASNYRLATYSGSPWSFQQNNRVEFDAVAGTTYHILVNAYAQGSTYEQHEQNTHQGEIHFNFSPVVPPSNSAFANATEIIGTEYNTIVSNYGATKESGEPNHGGLTGGRSLWWKWTAPESGPFIISTAGNIYDDYNAHRTGIGVYTGPTVNALSTVASNQNGAGPGTGNHTWSALQFNAIEGTTYYFGADSVNAGNLSFILNRPAPNDDFANATVMQGSRWTTSGHNLMTTLEAGEAKMQSYHTPPEPTNENTRSVWWRWTAPVSGTITLDSLGSQVHHVMGVYTGSSIGALNPVVVATNSGDYFNGESPNRARSGTKRLTFDAVAGTTYQISIQGAGFDVASSGPITLSLEGPPAVPFAPENFTAIRVGDSQINLTWDDIAVDEEYYELQRSPDGSTWDLLQEINPDTESYTDFDTATEGDYHYRLRAVNSVGESDWVTALVTVPQPPPAPSGLLVTALSAHDLTISWAVAPTATEHQLDRSEDGGETWSLLATLGANGSAFTDVGLEPDTTYHYRVRATNELGDSPWTSAVGATNALGTLSLSFPQSTYAETDGEFTATVTRSGTSGEQTVILSSGSVRLGVPHSVVIPDGQSSATFQVTIVDDEIVNSTDIANITAFAPAALIGESFEGPVDAAVNTQNTGWGWNGGWYSNNTPAVLVQPSLTYSKNGSIGTPGTRAIRLNAGGGSDARRNFASKYTTGDVWVSTLLHRNSTNWQTQMTIRENTWGGINAMVTYENATNHWRLKTSTGGDEPLVASNPSGQVHYIVMLFDFTNRQIHAWFNPEASGSAPANALGSATVDMPEGLTGISRLDLFGYSVLDGFDEIRVASRFADLNGGVTATRSLRLIDDEAYTPQQTWLEENFGHPIPSGNSDWYADPDSDGYPNIMEYALGGNPNIAHTVPLPQLGWIEVEGQTYLTFSIARNPAATDIEYLVQTSTDLVDGWLGGEEHIITLEEAPDWVHVRITTPLAEDFIRFLRLAVRPRF